MAIHYYDVERKSTGIESELKATFHHNLQSLLEVSDCVVLGTPAGTQIINSESLAWFKHGARFVNVARGSLVDEEALADAMESGQISTIALDVHANEPNINPRLLKFSSTRAMLTCHNAGGTVDTHIGFEELSMRNIMAVLSGSAPLTAVNLHYLKTKA
jgi:lactate dehydrogenase-like 2-hydroxyacid dehydrogenase